LILNMTLQWNGYLTSAKTGQKPAGHAMALLSVFPSEQNHTTKQRTNMAHYLVTARPNPDRLPKLRSELERDAFIDLKPFGHALTESLLNSRVQPDGRATWEEEDYCHPPLAEERAAVLDHYFGELEVRSVSAGSGWEEIRSLPPLFPELQTSEKP